MRAQSNLSEKKGGREGGREGGRDRSEVRGEGGREDGGASPGQITARRRRELYEK
jgi:hypothetical protein